ncbi:hypothetical protein NIES4071_86590 [Calothrix sp. NIES-4071]|nr:hypothetical protein NIES4071_86590 [Calothrix sp. NIES-4071]BAZ62926.1 hypothetical protein NIES4105_86520 [Calothrix sp. NIES-4105]
MLIITELCKLRNQLYTSTVMKKIIIFDTIISLTIGATSTYAQTRASQSGNAKIASQNKINPNNPNQVKPPKKPTYKDNSRVLESKLISCISRNW